MARSPVSIAAGGRPGQPEFDDIQGIVRFAHARLTAACFYLLRVADPAAAREWLATAAVTSAAKRDPPETALQVALTAEGLRALGISTAIVNGFSAEFTAGMAGDEARSRRLGDIGGNAPSSWRWGGPGYVPHLLAMVYAIPARLEEWKSRLAGPVWTRAFSVVECLDTSDMGGREPFGFVDGISQPALDWDRRVQPNDNMLQYRNLVALGEFLLGYPNEYDKYADRPLLDPAADPYALLPWAEDIPGKRDLGRNGTYLVFRDLRQDVRGFWQFLDRRAPAAGCTRQKLAEEMVGRTMLGEPLVPLSDRPIRGIGSGDDGRLNRFTFDTDGNGVRCPFGAHIRRANPRTADLPPETIGPVARLMRTLGGR
jgi:hypothetical protein